MKIDLIAGARPNFMKVAPIIRASRKIGGDQIKIRLVHTGQHYDYAMSGSFFKELGIPAPNINLEIGPASPAKQTGLIMEKYEELLNRENTDLCVVVGDVTSTMACAITAKKLHVKVAHVEAGIRSRDWKMPEEINRLVTDSISDIFFTTTEHAGDNLIKEGHSKSKIHLVGNTMIDTLVDKIDQLTAPSFFNEKNLLPQRYLVLTLHRPDNVDDPVRLAQYFEQIRIGAMGGNVIFPSHPRTKSIISKWGIDTSGIIVVDPLPYLEFNYLVKHSLGVITDSGGITEETTFLGIPCITLRNNTERPETCSIGTNELVGTNPEVIPDFISRMYSGTWKKGNIPQFWDGKTSERIVEKLLNYR